MNSVHVSQIMFAPSRASVMLLHRYWEDKGSRHRYLSSSSASGHSNNCDTHLGMKWLTRGGWKRRQREFIHGLGMTVALQPTCGCEGVEYCVIDKTQKPG